MKFLVGTEKNIEKYSDKRMQRNYPIRIYDDSVCNFLDALSKELRTDPEAKNYPDVLTFAFWCRRANIEKNKRLQSDKIRLGRGVVFHIPPSNVPVNFAFSMVFGLLAGNANIIRVSPKMTAQTTIICRCINQVLQTCENNISEFITIVSYEHDEDVTEGFSAICNGRVIWGGDSTIHEIQKAGISPRSVEIHFADRYSFGILSERAVGKLSKEELKRLAEQFYNDTYLMDQNACSTPHMLVWVKGDEIGLDRSEHIRENFYQAVCENAEKYDLSEIKVSDKYTDLCRIAAQQEVNMQTKHYGNLLYVTKLFEIPENLEDFRGRFGSFYEVRIQKLEELAHCFSQKTQTCLFFGVDKEELIKMVIEQKMLGIDRIVPFGRSLEMDVYWDGYDIIGELSRILQE